MTTLFDVFVTPAVLGVFESAWLVVAVVAAGAMAIGWLFRRVRMPDERLLAGVIVGVALGPTVLGRVAPDAWERAVLGAVAERADLRACQSELMAWQLASGHAGADANADAGSEHARRSTAIVEAEAAWRKAVARHQQPLRLAALILAAIVGGTAALRRHGDRGAPWPTAVSVGLWSAGVPISIGLLALWLRQEPMLSPAALAALGALAVGAWGLNTADRRAALRAGHEGPALISGASGVATFIASSLVLTGVLGTSAANVGDGFAAAAVVGMAGISVVWQATRGPGTTTAEHPRSNRLPRIVEITAMPALTGLLALQADWIADFSFWIVLGVVVASGDGRWFGAWSGVMLSGGRRPIDAARLALGACGSGPLQVAIAAIGACSGLLAREWTVAILLGAVATDITAPVRRRFAQAID